MAESFTLDEVRQMAAGGNAEPRSYSLDDVKAMEAQGFRDFILKRETTDLAHGVRRGVRDAINTGAELLSQGWDKLTGADAPSLSSLVTGQRNGEAQRVQAMNKAERDAATAGRPATPGSVLGYMGGNALVTAPVLRAAAGGLQATGIPMLSQLGTALETGGMATGRAGGGAVDMALRSLGGAGSGYITSGLADPASANTGAMVGAALPPALRLADAGTRVVRQGIASARMPADVRAARDIAEMAGANTRNPAEVASVRDALRQPGPSIIPGSLTVPEILQSPGVSQLQRSVKAVQPGPFVARDAERELARREVLERIAPIGNPREVAEEVGNSIAEYAVPAHNAARNRVRSAFESVDPFNESQVLLPIEQMRGARDRYLGPGTFGSGRGAQQAITEAERIGMQDLPAVRASAQGRAQDILQAVRAAGGINPLSAGGMSREITELGRRQTGTTGLVSGRGRSIDQLAELMHERGYLSSPDPSELLDAVRSNLSGRRVFGADVADDAFRGRMDRAMGDLPQAERIPQPVTFQELQNLRSSITEAWAEAHRFGRGREAATLDAQRKAIDQALENLAAGRGQPGEYFAPDMVRNFSEARQLHAAKEQRFKTGPQAGMFRQGGDGLPQIQGAEIARKFFNGNASQLADAQSFRRLVQDDPRLMQDLRRYAVSQAADQTDRLGNLTNAKFSKWLDARQLATGEIFTPQQRAWLRAIADDLRRADVAENLGRSTGSNTVQNAASVMRLGVADSPVTRFLAGRFPGGTAALDWMTAGAKTAKAERLGGLLVDPERTAGLLDTFIATQPRGLLGAPTGGGLLGSAATPFLLRSSPLLLSGGGQ